MKFDLRDGTISPHDVHRERNSEESVPARIFKRKSLLFLGKRWSFSLEEMVFEFGVYALLGGAGASSVHSIFWEF